MNLFYHFCRDENRRRKNIFYKVALVLGLFLVSDETFATTFVSRPFPETVNDAPIILRGEIGGSYSNWSSTQSGQRQIFTFTELTVSETLKGVLPDTSNIILRELGGEKDGVGMQVPGSVQFKQGEDVIVLLSERQADGSYPVRGLMMGKLEIHKDPDGNEILSGPSLSGTGEAHEHGQQNEEISGKSSEKRWRLDDLRQLIRSQGATSQAPSVVTPNASPRNLSPDFSPSSEDLQKISPAPALQNPTGTEMPNGLSSAQKWILAIGLGGAFYLLSRLKRRR